MSTVKSPPQATTAASKPEPDSLASLSQLNALMQAFTQANKLTDWKPSTDGWTALRLNKSRVTIQALEDEDALLVHLHMRAVPQDAAKRSALYEALLRLNIELAAADRLGIDAHEKTAVYQRIVSLSGLDAQSFGDELWDVFDSAAELEPELPKG